MDKLPYQKLLEEINNELDDDNEEFNERHNRLLILASENGYLDIVKQIIFKQFTPKVLIVGTYFIPKHKN